MSDKGILCVLLVVTVVVVQCVGQGHPMCVIGVDRGCGCCPVCRARASRVCYWWWLWLLSSVLGKGILCVLLVLTVAVVVVQCVRQGHPVWPCGWLHSEVLLGK